MRKFTGFLIAMAFLLCAFTAQAESDIDVYVPSAGEQCTSDLSCAPGELCINEICSVPVSCTNDLQCGEGELCIDDICQEAECQTSADCEDGLVCDNASSFTCVECVSDANCNVGEFCTNNTCAAGDDCELRIKPRRININKKKRPSLVYKLLKFRGNENFVIPLNADGNLDPNQCDFGPLGAGGSEIRTKRNSLKIIMNADRETETGFYPIRIGNCIGEIELYDKKNKGAR
jgi:Cys-rich repeat protein